MDHWRLERDQPYNMHAQDTDGGRPQTSGTTPTKTKPNNERGSKKGSGEVVGCRFGLSNF